MRPAATLIVNPASGAGRTGRHLDQLRAAARRAFDEVDLRLTRAPGDARRLAEDAARAGVKVVVAVGGDGTAGEVASGLCAVDMPAQARPAFTLVPAGTGCDLARTLNVPRSWEAAFDALGDAEVRLCDIIEIDAGGDVFRSVNMVTMGVGGDVVTFNTPALKRLGGRVSFMLATLRAFIGWSGPVVSLRWDGPDGAGAWRGRLSNAFIANGAHCGGGMKPVGAASMADGVLQLALVTHRSLLPGLKIIPRLYDGRLGEAPGVVTARLTSLTAEVSEGAAVGLDIDGERGPQLPLRLRCVPSALPVLATRWSVS